jgi:hypothetical protein
VGQRAAQLAAPEADEVSLRDGEVDEAADMGPVDATPVPHQPTWSAYLPACRTVLPTFPERGRLYARLIRQR